jgi:hypothetical protein
VNNSPYGQPSIGFCRLLYIKAFASQGQQYFCDVAYRKLLILKESVEKLRQMKQFFTIAVSILMRKMHSLDENALELHRNRHQARRNDS